MAMHRLPCGTRDLPSVYSGNPVRLWRYSWCMVGIQASNPTSAPRLCDFSTYSPLCRGTSVRSHGRTVLRGASCWHSIYGVGGVSRKKSS